MEKAVKFQSQSKMLFGILHLPKSGMIETVVLMIVGGPQTRVGSQRSYVQLARYLADRDVAVLRFDYQGIGDSEGPFVGFEGAEPSIRSAIDFLYTELPSLNSLIIWSLCDGASASAFYASKDSERIDAMILANPWIETEEGQARTIIKQYYKNRFFEKTFWLKVIKFDFNLKESLLSFLDLKRKSRETQNGNDNKSVVTDSLPVRVLKGLIAFRKPMHFLISSKDITGMEFYEHAKNNAEMVRLQNAGLVHFHFIADADHTFSSTKTKQSAFQATMNALEMIKAVDSKKRVKNLTGA